MKKNITGYLLYHSKLEKWHSNLSLDSWSDIIMGCSLFYRMEHLTKAVDRGLFFRKLTDEDLECLIVFTVEDGGIDYTSGVPYTISSLLGGKKLWAI